MPHTAQRPDRINLRLSRAVKRRLERAAACSDKTLTDFVIDVALQKADAIVRKRLSRLRRWSGSASPRVFVAEMPAEPKRIAGFFTLSASRVRALVPYKALSYMSAMKVVATRL